MTVLCVPYSLDSGLRAGSTNESAGSGISTTGRRCKPLFQELWIAVRWVLLGSARHRLEGLRVAAIEACTSLEQRLVPDGGFILSDSVIGVCG